MNPSLWTTSSEGDSADTKPMDLDALRQHMVQCTSDRGRLVALHCGGLKLQAWVLARRVTTLALLVALLAAGAMLMPVQ